VKYLQGNYSCGEPPLSNCNVFTLPIVGFSAQRYYHLPPTASGLLGNTTPTVPIEFQAFILYINSSKSFPEFRGRSGFDGRAETRVACTGCRWPVKKRLLHNRQRLWCSCSRL